MYQSIAIRLKHWLLFQSNPQFRDAYQKSNVTMTNAIT